jgi:transposase-like protein
MRLKAPFPSSAWSRGRSRDSRRLRQADRFKCPHKYGAIIRLWESAWEEFIPFLDYDLEIRTVICSTNPIESLNARYRRRSEPGTTSRPSKQR